MTGGNQFLSFLRIPTAILEGLIFITRYVYEYDSLYEYTTQNWNYDFPLSELGLRNRDENNFTKLDLFLYQIDPFILLLLVYNTWTNVSEEDMRLIQFQSSYFIPNIFSFGRENSSLSESSKSSFGGRFVDTFLAIPESTRHLLDCILNNI